MFDSSDTPNGAGDDASDAVPAGGALGRLRMLGDAFAAAMREVSPEELADASLSELLVEAEGWRNVLDASEARWLAAWDARQVWAGDGAHSGAGWMAASSTVSRSAAASLIGVGRDLRSMPRVAEAFAAGRIGIAQTRLLASAWREAPVLFAEHEEMLVEFAESLRAEESSRALAHWVAHANPDGAADREARRYKQRSLSLHAGFDGMWNLQGRLTAETGEALRDVLDAIAQGMYRCDKTLADPNTDPSLIRTALQRRHDALQDLATSHHTTTDSDGTAVNLPSITAVINIEALSDEHTHGGDPVGETATGAVVTQTAAMRLACDCTLSRIVMGPGSVPIDLGATSRLASPAQRRALAVRYRGCAFPGCDRPPGWTHAHHLVHWVNKGPTDLDNLIPLCNYHHHCVHEGGFGAKRLPNGELQFTKPNGDTLTVPKRRAPDPTQHKPHAA